MYILMQPLCGTDPMIVLEYSMLVLESCPSQTIELFLSGNIPADLVNSYLKQHAPNMQATYLELMLAMNEHEISGNLNIMWSKLKLHGLQKKKLMYSGEPKIRNILHNSLDAVMSNRVIACKSSKEIWDTLETQCQGSASFSFSNFLLLFKAVAGGMIRNLMCRLPKLITVESPFILQSENA